MAIDLTHSEIALLKELKVAGALGRLKSRLLRTAGFGRLVKANYITAKPVNKCSAMYFITKRGSHALEQAVPQ
jgi:hypothetical protein